MVQALNQYITISHSASDFVVYIFLFLLDGFVCWFIVIFKNLSHSWKCPWKKNFFFFVSYFVTFRNSNIFCFAFIFIFLMNLQLCAYLRNTKTWNYLACWLDFFLLTSAESFPPFSLNNITFESNNVTNCVLEQLHWMYKSVNTGWFGGTV